MMCHEIEGLLRFSFIGHTTPGVCHLVTDLVNAGAFPQAEHGFIVPDSALERIDLLVALAEVGLVACTRQDLGVRAWKLTQLGMSRVVGGMRLTSSTSATAPRPVSQGQDMTRYEILMALQGDGWSWSLLSPKLQQQMVPYQVGEPKVFYTSTLPATNCSSYFLALLRAPQLRTKGVLNVPHGKPPEYYKALFKSTHAEGDPDPVMDDVAVVALEDHADANEDSDGDSNVDDSTGDECDEASVPARAIGSEEVAPVEVERQLVRIDGPEALVGLRGDKDPWRLLGDFHWGCFRFTYKKISTENEAYQAQCPFHKKSEKTMCKKTIKCVDSTFEGHRRCVDRLRFWCAMAGSYDRQRSHMAQHPSLDEVPPSEVVEASLNDELKAGPTWPILTDAELDQLEVVHAASAPANGRAKAKARGKGKAAPKGVASASRPLRAAMSPVVTDSGDDSSSLSTSNSSNSSAGSSSSSAR